MPQELLPVSVRPRIQSLCAQVAVSTPLEMRLDGDAFIREIMSMKDTLTVAELEFLANPLYGRFLSMTSWAKRVLASRAEPEADTYGDLIAQLEKSPEPTVEAPK